MHSTAHCSRNADGLLASLASAEIVVDDFSVSSEIESPIVDLDLDARHVINPGQERRFSLGDLTHGDLTLAADVSVTTPATMTATFANAPQGGGGNYDGVGFGYIWDEPIDITEGGQNDTVFIDIPSISGVDVPDLLKVGIHGRFFSQVEIPQGTSGPLTIAFPLDGFLDRSGDRPDEFFYDQVSLFGISFTELGPFPEPIPGVFWTLKMAPIRIGTVPEPNQSVYVLGFLACILIHGFRSASNRTR